MEVSLSAAGERVFVAALQDNRSLRCRAMEIRQRGWGSCEERWPCAQLIEYLRRALGAPFIGVIADDVNGSPMLGTSRRSGLAWSAAKREKSRRTSGLLGGT